MERKTKVNQFAIAWMFHFTMFLVTIFASGTKYPYALTMYIGFVDVFIFLLLRGFRIRIKIGYFLWLMFVIYIWMYAKSYSTYVLYYNVPILCLIISLILCADKIDSDKCIRMLFIFALMELIIVSIEGLLGNSVGNILSILLNPNTYNAEMRHIARKTEYQGLAASNNIVTYSSVIVAAVGMYLYRTEYTLKYRRWKKYLMFVLVILVIMVFEQQRTNLLFIPLSFAVVYIVSDRKNQHYKFLTVSFLGGIGFIVFYNLMPLMSSINSISRIINTVDMFLNGQNILSNRSFLYGRAIEMWKAKPVWGNGWYQFFLSNNGILTVGTYSHAHNMIYELLADGGIVGLVIGLTPLMYTFIENVRLLTKCKGRKDKYEDKFRFTLLVQIFFIFDSFLHVTFYHSFIMMIYLLEIIIFYSVKEEFYKECSR